ncbi:toll/interleukin-1 receptor domain-containing protein [Frankia sp. AgB1.9]|uniref:toll/interleukin-1 receptor domain-containing protein n=1 Tax=unclassified Frankia TaxID=2632575 RepID=UPI0019341C40|nr:MULTISPECIES: toll/interleukin-1 receptor domain-containing protein [unclassified Frankia]MBL7492345.1 toll/interleukin-1 receptor domain-containing protein [Frankia sp. AgW1.1]MBL7547000.1 toll/interleukin-1 receptor domain-containing protein [Frankia sp. AgB1.9]MBL7622289.1 toll/interleukin-1 receptor domain-containing protein [Frankia sp. AgB1.8]
MEEVRIFVSYTTRNNEVHGLELGQAFAEYLEDAIKKSDQLRNTTFTIFRSMDIPAGRTWSKDLVEYLNRCNVFVALCSPEYFRERWPGLEWSFFQHRLRSGKTFFPATLPELVIPVIWTSLDDYKPQILKNLQIVKLTERSPDATPLRGYYLDLDPYGRRLRGAMEKIAVRIVQAVRAAQQLATTNKMKIDDMVPELDESQVSKVAPAFGGSNHFIGPPKPCSVVPAVPGVLGSWAPFGLPANSSAMTWAMAEQHIPYLRADKEIQRYNFRTGGDETSFESPPDMTDSEVTGLFLADSAHLTTVPAAGVALKTTFDGWGNGSGKRRVLIVSPSQTALDKHFDDAAKSNERTVVNLGKDNIDAFTRSLADGLEAQWKDLTTQEQARSASVLPSSPPVREEPNDGA